MAAIIQYDFFDKNDDLSILKKEIEYYHEKLENVRKGLFSRHHQNQKAINELLSMILCQQEEIAKLKCEIIKIKN